MPEKEGRPRDPEVELASILLHTGIQAAGAFLETPQGKKLKADVQAGVRRGVKNLRHPKRTKTFSWGHEDTSITPANTICASCPLNLLDESNEKPPCESKNITYAHHTVVKARHLKDPECHLINSE